MITIQKLYIVDLLKTLFILTIGMSALFGILGLSERLADFMQYDPALSQLAEYALAGIPRYILYFLPMGALLSGLFVFSMAVKRREIVAIKTSGGKMRALLKPFITLGVLLTFFGFVLGEFIVPSTSIKVREIANEITKKGASKSLFKDGVLYMRGKDGSIVKIGLYMPEMNMSKDVSVFKYSDSGMTVRIDAKSALWENSHWKLMDVTIYNFIDGKYSFSKEMIYAEIESPNIFKEDALKVEEMTIIELVRYKNRLTEAGFKNNKLSVDVSSRISYPLINLFMLLLGISLSIGGEKRGFEKIFGLKSHSAHSHAGVLSAGLGLAISVAYWLSYTFCLSLGYSGAIPPIIAPWIAPAVFSLVSMYLFLSIPE